MPDTKAFPAPPDEGWAGALAAPGVGRDAEEPAGFADLAALAGLVRAHAGLTGKKALSVVGRILDTSDPLRGPGDDGALSAISGRVAVVCGEAIHPDLVAADPFAAGVAAVVANVNDIAAMGGRPEGIVNTVVGSEALAAEVLRGLRHAAGLYGIRVMGGHFTEHAGSSALSAFGLGHAVDGGRTGSLARVEPGQKLVFACCPEGTMRDDFSIFTTLARQGPRLRVHIRLPAKALSEGQALAAKDVSMAGAIGSLAMLLEYRRLGARVDLDRLPRPEGVGLGPWLTAFPTYAFWFAGTPDGAPRCAARFRRHGLAAEVVGEITDDPKIVLRRGAAAAEVVNLRRESITGLWPQT